ncbi:MAG: hypothetical protein WCS88_04070 [Patescibacteria group bacterium]|jgi:hypothetical protein
MALKTLSQLDTIAEFIGSLADSLHGTGPVSKQALVDMMDTMFSLSNQARSQVQTGMVSAAGTTPNTIAIYYANRSAGNAAVKGVWLNFAAVTDRILLGAGEWANSYTIAGVTPIPAALLASTDYAVAFVLALVAGVPTEFAVFSAAAATGTAVPPTPTQIHTALAAVADIDATCMLVTGRCVIARDGAGNVVTTDTDPAAVSAPGSALLTERMSAGILATAV